MHAGDGLEDVVRGERVALLDLQLVGQDVEQDFRIRIGVDVAAVVLVHLAAQRLGVDEVAVVAERDAVGRVDVEGLGLGRALRSCRRITAVADADAAAQLEHVRGAEYVAHQPRALVQAQALAVDRGDAGGVLAAVLQHGERVVQRGRDFGFSDDADDAAHGGFAFLDQTAEWL